MIKLLVGVAVVLTAYFESVPAFFALSVVVLLLLVVHYWLDQVSASVRIDRQLEGRLFYGESTTVTVRVQNRSALPIPWVLVREHLPVALMSPCVISRVMSLGAGQTGEIRYRLVGRERGFHLVGPLEISLGDVAGIGGRDLAAPRKQRLIVYPRILTPEEFELPSLALFGELRTRRRILGDPARVTGIRDYTPGDPLHDIHWRATASVGSLQVKQYRPSTTVQTMIFLDLQHRTYHTWSIVPTSEFAITVAATVANRMLDQRQEVGIVTNGMLALPPEELEESSGTSGSVDGVSDGTRSVPAPVVAPAKGRTQLLRVLELLAQVTIHDHAESLQTLLTRHAVGLPWGSTVAIVTAALDDDLFLTLHRLREAGLCVVLYLIDRSGDRAGLEARAQAIGVRLHFLCHDPRNKEHIAL